MAAHKAETDRLAGLEKPVRQAKTDLEAPYRKRLMDELIASFRSTCRLAWRTPAEQTYRWTEAQRQADSEHADDGHAGEGKDHRGEDRRVMTEEERSKHRELNAELERLRKLRPPPYASAMAIGDSGASAPPSYFLHRGSPDAKGPAMTPGVLSVVERNRIRLSQAARRKQVTWRRRGFAEWVASPPIR